MIEDDDRADEFADMSVEDYAAERGVELVDSEEGDSMKKENGSRPVTTATAGENPAEARENAAAAALQTAQQALGKVSELQERNRELQTEIDERDAQFDKIVAVVEDDDRDFSPEDRLEEIDKILSEGDEEGEE